MKMNIDITNKEVQAQMDILSRFTDDQLAEAFDKVEHSRLSGFKKEIVKTVIKAEFHRRKISNDMHGSC